MGTESPELTPARRNYVARFDDMLRDRTAESARRYAGARDLLFAEAGHTVVSSRRPKRADPWNALLFTIMAMIKADLEDGGAEMR